MIKKLTYIIIIYSIIGVLNYEETPFYSIEVSINDGKFTTVMSIAVEIINQNEWPPTFLKSGKGPLYTCIITSFTHIQKIDLHFGKV